MRNGHGLPVACSAPPPKSAVATNCSDGCQQTQQNEAISFEENDEVEEDSDSKSFTNKPDYRKTVNASSGRDVKGMMPPSEETNTANSSAQSTCSSPNVSSVQCSLNSTHIDNNSDVKLSLSAVSSAVIKDLLTSKLFNVSTKLAFHESTEKLKKEKHIVVNKSTSASSMSGNKLWTSPSNFSSLTNVKNRVQPVRSLHHCNELNPYTDISSVSSGGLTSDDDSDVCESDNFEHFVVNDVGAINLVKGECSKTSSSDGVSHHKTGWATKPGQSQTIADESIQNVPLCLTVNKRPETQPVKSPPVKNYGLVLHQPSTFRHVSNPVSYSAFAPKYPAQWPLLHIPFRSSGFRGSSIVGSDTVHLREMQFRPQVQRRHTCDTKFPDDSDSNDLSSDSDSSGDDLLPLFDKVRSSSKMCDKQITQQKLVPKMQSSVRGGVQGDQSCSSHKSASQDTSVSSLPCSVSTNFVKSVAYDGNIIPSSANVEKCSEPSRNEKLVDIIIPAAVSNTQNVASCPTTQSAGIPGPVNKLLSAEHFNGMFKSCDQTKQNVKKNKPKRLTVAKVSNVRCSRKKSNDIKNVQNDTPSLKITCSNINVVNGCHSVCSADEGPNKETNANLGNVINNTISTKPNDICCIMTVSEGPCKTTAVCSTVSEVSSSQMCDSTSCSSQDLREEALKVVTHCLKDLLFRVVNFPNKPTINTCIDSVLPANGIEILSCKDNRAEKETSSGKISFPGLKNYEKLSNNGSEIIEKNEEKCSENNVSSTCVDASYHQFSDKSTKSVQVEMKNNESSMLGEILQAALIPNIISATEYFINHECEMATYGLGLLSGDKLLSKDGLNSQNILCTDPSPQFSSMSVTDSSNSFSKCVSLDKSCGINFSDFGSCHQKFSFDDFTLARNVEEKCLMIQKSLNRKNLGNNNAFSRKNENYIMARTSSVTGVTCSLPLSKVSLALAGCALAVESADESKVNHSGVFPLSYCVASVNSNGPGNELVENSTVEGSKSFPNMRFGDNDDTHFCIRTVNSSVRSVSSSAQTDLSYENSFTSSTEVPRKFLFQVQPIHHMKLGDGQKLFACDICSGVYQRSFSLKRHYLRSHINYRHLTERDISNCGIIVGDKMAVQTGTNTKIYMQNSKLTSQKLESGQHETDTSKNELTNSSSECTKFVKAVTSSEQNVTDTNSKTLTSNKDVEENKLLPIEVLLRSSKEIKHIQFPALYRCHFCGICFDLKEHLKIHLLNHPPAVTGISKETNSYVCGTCSLVFTHKHNYLRHCASENHKNATKPQSFCIKEYLCLYCDKGFKTSAIRKRHQSRMHHYFAKQKRPGKRRFHPCSYCPSTAHKFKDLTILMKHMVTSHPDKYLGCLACCERFDCKDAFDSHILNFHKKNKSKVLKGAELKEVKAGSVPLEITRGNDTSSLSNNLVPILKVSLDDHNKTPTKKMPERKLNEHNDEHNVDDENNCSSKGLNSSGVNDEFRYTCGVCQKMFTNYVNMCRHRRLAHGTITAKSKKVKKGVDSDGSGMCSTSSQSGDSRSESPAVASKAPTDLSNKTQGTAQVVQTPGVCESKMDPETLFYSKIAINIRDNLLNHLDGKLHDNTTTTMTIKESKVVERSIATDRPKRGEKSVLKVDCGTVNSQSRDSGSADVGEHKQTNDGERSKESGRRGHTHKVPWEKYNFPKNYDGKGDGLASYIKDMSHLDISTQLVMQQNLQRVNSATDKGRGLVTEGQETEDIQASDFPKGLCLMQRNCLNVLSDVFSNSRNESTLTRACSSSSVPSLLNSKDVLLGEGHNLKRRKSLSDIKLPSATGENCSGGIPGNKLDKDVELSGEWVRPRSYICGACSERFCDFYDLEDHKYAAHPNVWCTHFEFEESSITGMSFDKSKSHTSFPGNLSRRYLQTSGTLEVKAFVPPTTSLDSQCTKCSKNFNSLPEFHRHILDCGGDTTWMLTMVAATSSNSRRNRKWRPFGSRRRRHQGRRGMKRNIPSSPIKLPQYRVRHRGTDSDSIQRMIANLPAKRTSRRVIQFNEDEVKTRSQGTVHCNRILRKRFKVPTFIQNVHHKSWSGRSSTARGLTLSQYQKVSSSETRNSKTIQKIHRMSSESTASKLLRSSRNFLQNKTSTSKAVKGVIRVSVPNNQPNASVTDDRTKGSEEYDDNCAPKTRNMLAKHTQGNNVAIVSSKVKRSRFLRNSVISNIKSKYRNSVPGLSGETLSGKYINSRKMIRRRRETIKNGCLLPSAEVEKHCITELTLPRRSGRTSVLQGKIHTPKANATVLSTDVTVPAIGNISTLNNCKLTSIVSPAADNIDSTKTLQGETAGEQISVNKSSVKDENVKPEKRKKILKMTSVGANKAKTNLVKVSHLECEKSEITVEGLACKDCSVVCDSIVSTQCIESFALHNKMTNISSVQKIQTPRMCLSCGKKFKVISTLEKHLKKCGFAVNKSVVKKSGLVNCKSERRSTRTLQNNTRKTEMIEKKEVDDNMPELQKEEPLEVFSVNESVKKCDDIVNEIPVLSPVSQETALIHAKSSGNKDQEKCALTILNCVKGKRKSKRGLAVLPCDDVSDIVQNKISGKSSSVFKLEKNILSKRSSFQNDKSKCVDTQIVVFPQVKNSKSLDCKNLRKMHGRKKGTVNKSCTAVAKDTENSNLHTLISSEVMKIPPDSYGGEEPILPISLESNVTDDAIDPSLPQKIMKANKGKNKCSRKSVAFENIESVAKVVNRKPKQSKKLNQNESQCSPSDPNCVSETEVILDGVKRLLKKAEGKVTKSKIERQIKRKVPVVKSNCDKKINQLRTSKRLSKVVSDCGTAKNISLQHNIKNIEVEDENCLDLRLDLSPKHITTLVGQCCKEKKNSDECCVCVSSPVSPEEVSETVTNPCNIQFPPSIQKSHCVVDDKKEVKVKTSSPIIVNSNKENCSQTDAVCVTEDKKAKEEIELSVKDKFMVEKSNIVVNKKLDKESKDFSADVDSVQELLNEVTNDSRNGNIQSGFKKKQCLVLKKRGKKMLSVADVSNKKCKINNRKSNLKQCKDLKVKSTQKVSILELKINATDISEVVMSSKSNLVNSLAEVNESMEPVGELPQADGLENLMMKGKGKISSHEKSLKTDVKEPCEFLLQDDDAGCKTQSVSDLKSANSVKSKRTVVSPAGKRKYKFPKIKSRTSLKCSTVKRKQFRKNTFRSLKIVEGDLNVFSECVKNDFTKTGFSEAEIVPLCAEVQSTSRSVAMDTSENAGVSELGLFNNTERYSETLEVNGEIENNKSLEAIIDTGKKLESVAVKEVKEISCSDLVIEKCGVTTILDNVIDTSLSKDAVCCEDKEYKPNETILKTDNAKEGTLITEVSALSESSIDADEDLLPIAKLREISLGRIRNTSRLNRFNRKQVKKGRKLRMKTVEIKDMQLKSEVRHQNTTKPDNIVHTVEDSNCLVKIQEGIQLNAKECADTANDIVNHEENLLLAGNRLLRTRRNSSSEKNVLSHLERRESRARSTRWNLSYEEMYTSSDIASEADSQDFDSNQKENKSVLRGHHRRRSRRMKSAKPKCNFFHQDKKRRKSLRRLTVLRNQRKAEMRLETKEYKNNETSLAESLARHNIQECCKTSMKITVTDSVFGIESFDQMVLEKKSEDTVLESAAEEETFSKITKTAVINKVFCKKPKKNNVYGVGIKGKRSTPITTAEERLHDIVHTANLGYSLENFKTSCNVNFSSVDKKSISCNTDMITFEKFNFAEVCKTDLILSGDCISEKSNNSSQIMEQVCEMPKTLGEGKVCTSKKVKNKKLHKFLVKNKFSRGTKFDTTQGRRKPKMYSKKGHINTLDQVNSMVPEEFITTILDKNDGIVKRLCENEVMPFTNVEKLVEFAGSAEFPETSESISTEEHDIISDTHLILDKIVTWVENVAQNDTHFVGNSVGVDSKEPRAHSGEECIISKEENVIPNEDDHTIRGHSLLREMSFANPNHVGDVEHEVITTVSPCSLIQQQPNDNSSLCNERPDICDTASRETTPKLNCLKPLNSYKTFNNHEGEKRFLKDAHYCSTCKKNYSSSSNLVKHKLSVFHKKNLSLDVSASDGATVESGSNSSFPDKKSSMTSDKTGTEDNCLDGNDAVCFPGVSPNFMPVFSDEVPLSVIAKYMSNGRLKPRSRILANINCHKKKTTLKNNRKNKEKLFHQKKKLFEKCKKKVLKEEDCVKLQATDEVFVISDNITNVHEDSVSCCVEVSSGFGMLDGEISVIKSDDAENERNFVSDSNIGYDVPCEELVETDKSMLTLTLIDGNDASENNLPSIVSEEHFHQPLSLAVLASRNIDKDVLNNINKVCISPLSHAKLSDGKKICSVEMETISSPVEITVGRPQWQPSLKSILALPSSFKELCFDSVLLNEAETQGAIFGELNSSNAFHKFDAKSFDVEICSSQNSEKQQLNPPLESVSVHCNKDCNSKTSAFSEELETPVSSCEIHTPVSLEACVEVASLNEEESSRNEVKKVEKLTWPNNVFEVEDPKSGGEKTVPGQISADGNKVALELELEESLVVQEATKTSQDRVCSPQPSQSVFLEPELQPSLVQDTTSRSLDDMKCLPEKFNKSNEQLNFLQIYDGPTFPEEFESRRILLEQPVPGKVVGAESMQMSALQERTVLQNQISQGDNWKHSAAKNFEDDTSKVSKTKGYVPEKLQVQLPLLKIPDVQFLLAHHTDTQKTAFSDSNTRKSLEGFGSKNIGEQQKVHVASALVKSVPDQVESEVCHSDFPQVQLKHQDCELSPVENKCENSFSSSIDGNLPQPIIDDYEKQLCISFDDENVQQVSEMADLSQQETDSYGSASILVPEIKIQEVDNYVSVQEPVHDQVRDITNTLYLPSLQKSSSNEYEDVASVNHKELDDTIETSDSFISETMPQTLKNALLFAKAATQPSNYVDLGIDAQSASKQSKPSKEGINSQNCEIITANETQQSGDEWNPARSYQETHILPPEATGDELIPKHPGHKIISHSSLDCNSGENKLWKHQNDSRSHNSVSQVQLQILGNDSSWSQENDHCLTSTHLPVEHISDNEPALNSTLCEPVIQDSSHKQFDIGPILNTSEISEDAVCLPKSVVEVSSGHCDLSGQEMHDDLAWSKKDSTSEIVKENSSVEQEVEYSSLHRLAEVVIWSQNNTTSSVLDSTLCRQNNFHTALEISDMSWPHKIDSRAPVLCDSSQHNIHEPSSDGHVNWPQKEPNNDIIYQDSSNQQSGIHSVNKISGEKVAWSQNNKVCSPVLPKYSCEHDVSQPPLKVTENNYTWSQNHDISMSVLQNLASEQHKSCSSTLQSSEPTISVSQGNENCMSALQTLSSEQNHTNHSSVNISENNMTWPQVHKPESSHSQSCESDIQQPAVPSHELTWSQKENTTALQTISMVKERLNVMVTDADLTKPETSVTYTFSPTSGEHNVHQTSYTDPEFDVCLAPQPELTCAQQDYSYENVNLHPELQSSKMSNLQLHNQSTFAPIHQSSPSEPTIIPDVHSAESAFQKSAADEFVNQFSSLDDDNAQVSRNQQNNVLKKLPMQLLKATEVDHSLHQKPKSTVDLLKDTHVGLPLQEESRTQVDLCAKLLKSDMDRASAQQDGENQDLRFQVGSVTWCGREGAANWSNEQVPNSSSWTGQGELSSNPGWSEWVAGNMNWSQQAAPHFYSTSGPAGGSLGSIIDSVNQILNEETGSGGNSTRTALPGDYGSYETLPAGCVVPRGLEELQRAMGATDEEMLMLQKLGENCCWPLENAEIMDLDGHKQTSEKHDTTQKVKDTEKAITDNQSSTKKAAVTSGRRQRGEDRPFGHNHNILSQYESKEMVCPVCNKRFLGLTALQTHATSAHNLDQAADRKAKVTERSRQALISSIACSSFFQVNNSRHMCTTCKELHVDQESLRQHVEAMHNGDASAAGTEGSQDPRKSICASDKKAEGLKSQMSSALGGLLNRALSSVFISRLSKEISARSELDSSLQSSENEEKQQSQGNANVQGKHAHQLKGDLDDTKQKQYVCELCEMKFHHLGSKNRHVQTVHLKMPRNLSMTDAAVESSIPDGDGSSKEEQENESAWASQSPPEWNTEPNMDGEILDGSFLCQDCGINFQTPQEVLSHRQLEHPLPESQPHCVSYGSKELTSDKVSLVGDSDDAASTPEMTDNIVNSGEDNMPTSVTEGNLAVEDVVNPAKLSGQVASEKTVEKLLFSSSLGRMSEGATKKVAKSKVNIKELEKQLCQNDAIIKAKAEAAIRELSLSRKGRNSAANTRWGVQRYKFTVPDRHPISEKMGEKVAPQTDDRYSYPLIRKVSNSRFASLTERKKKLGSKLEMLACVKVVSKENIEKDIQDTDITSVDIYEFDEDECSATKEFSLRGITVPPTSKVVVPAEEQELPIAASKDCASSAGSSAAETCVQADVCHEQVKIVSLPCTLPRERLGENFAKCNDNQVQQQELDDEIPYVQTSLGEENGMKETNNSQKHHSSGDKLLDGSEKLLCSEQSLRVSEEEIEVGEKHTCLESSLQDVASESSGSNSSAKHSVRYKKDKSVTTSKISRKQKTSDPCSTNEKVTNLQKKRKVNEGFDMPNRKRAPQNDSSKSETQESVPLGRRQVKKVSYVELYDSEVEDQFLFYSDDDDGQVDDLKFKPKCKNPKKKQSKPDKKKRKSDQLIVQQGDTCNSETVTHSHKKKCKQKLQSVDISCSVPKSDDFSETCRNDTPVIEANNFQPKWLYASEPVTDEDNTSESDQGDKQKTTKTDLLKTVFAKSRRSSTTIVSGSGGTIPEVDSRTNANCVKHKHRS